MVSYGIDPKTQMIYYTLFYLAKIKKFVWSIK